MITSTDYYVVKKKTPVFGIGEKLYKMIIHNKVCYGTDKINKFHLQEFLDDKPELFEYIGEAQ